MKEQENTRKIICIIIAVIIILGVIVWKVKGFNKELLYSNRQQINVSSSTSLDEGKINEISKSILTNRKVKTLKLERFGNAVQIISESITDEEKERIVNKINEECGTDISNDDTKIVDVEETRIKDIFKPYILPLIITLVAILLYFLVMYHKIGLKEILIKGIGLPIVAELLYYSIIAITRIEFGRIQNSIALGIYVVVMGILAIYLQKEKEKLHQNNNKKEND